MESVLSIDASTSPAQAVVVGIDGTELSVIEHHFCPFESVEGLVERLRELEGVVRTKWTNCILFIRGEQHLSLNLSLPFKDSKQISRVVLPEVQDLVPFDLDEFHLAHRSVGTTQDGDSEVLVGIVPRSELESILPFLRDVSIDPLIVSTPSSALQGLFELHGAALEANSTVILEQGGMIYVGSFIKGTLISERILSRNSFVDPKAANAEVELAIAAVEMKHSVPCPMVYILSEGGDPIVNSLPGRTIHPLSSITLFPNLNQRVSIIALLGALFAKDSTVQLPISNFRTGAFSYRPHMTEVRRGMKMLLPYLLALIFAAVACIGSWYGAREYKMNNLRNLMLEEIKTEIPSFNSTAGDETAALQKESTTLQSLLKELGSPLTASPLDVLAAVTEDVTSVGGVAVNRINIRNGEVRIEGTAPNYKTLDRLESTLKKRKNIFCRVKSDSPASGSRDNARDYQITIGICE